MVLVEACTASEVDAAFETMSQQKVGGLLVGGEAFFGQSSDQIVKLAQHHGIPVVTAWRRFTEAGGLMSYGTPWTEAYRQVGVYIGKILNGAATSRPTCDRTHDIRVNCQP
jgi:putative ABC transport system substrate-binding protein